MRRRGKYNARRTVVDGVTFDSKSEARRYEELKLMSRAGEIYGLELQCRYPLWGCGSNGSPVTKVCDYVADFRYWRTCDGAMIVEDAKGSARTITPLFRLKKKLMLVCHGIEVQVVIMGRGAR